MLVRIDGEDSENEIFTLEQSLAEAQKALETAQKNLDNCNAVAPIDGTVMGLALTPGQELEANTTVIQIADTSTILVDATVDERNISYVKQGMPVTVKILGRHGVHGHSGVGEPDQQGGKRRGLLSHGHLPGQSRRHHR